MKVQPQSVVAACNLALIAILQNKMETAWTHAEKAESWEPGSALVYHVWSEMGLSLNKQKNSERATSALLRAAALQPRLPEPWINLGLIHHQNGDWPTAREYYRKAIEADRDSHGQNDEDIDRKIGDRQVDLHARVPWVRAWRHAGAAGCPSWA